MLNSILEYLNCKKCLNNEYNDEIIINNNMKNRENMQINEDDEIDYEEENKNDMEFILNMQKEINKQNLELKSELDNIKKEKALLEENMDKQGNMLSSMKKNKS